MQPAQAWIDMRLIFDLKVNLPTDGITLGQDITGADAVRSRQCSCAAASAFNGSFIAARCCRFTFSHTVSQVSQLQFHMGIIAKGLAKQQLMVLHRDVVAASGCRVHPGLPHQVPLCVARGHCWGSRRERQSRLLLLAGHGTPPSLSTLRTTPLSLLLKQLSSTCEL